MPYLTVVYLILFYITHNDCQLINSTSEERLNMSRTSTVTLAKVALRKEILMQLASLSAKEKLKQSKIVREKLFNLEEFKNAKYISVYLSLQNEIDTELIVKRIFQDGKRCFVPRYRQKVMEMVELYSMKDWATLPLTKLNIKQPSFQDNRTNCIETGLDLIITPGVAFTTSGKRLGHGGGYYDRFLKDFSDRQNVPPFVIALSFREQMVQQIPTEETDFPVNLVLYPK